MQLLLPFVQPSETCPAEHADAVLAAEAVPTAPPSLISPDKELKIAKWDAVTAPLSQFALHVPAKAHDAPLTVVAFDT